MKPHEVVARALSGLVGDDATVFDGEAVTAAVHDPARLQDACRAVVAELRGLGIDPMAPDVPGGVHVEGFFDPIADLATVAVTGLDESLIERPDALRSLDFIVTFRGGLRVEGWYRPDPERLDLRNVTRPDGEPVAPEEILGDLTDQELEELHTAAAAAWREIDANPPPDQ